MPGVIGCCLCGHAGHDKDSCPHFGYATSAQLFEELGTPPQEAEKMERGLNAIIRRIDIKENNKMTTSKPWFSIKQVKDICKAHKRNVGTHPVWPLAEQLLIVMQREAKLRQTLEEIIIVAWADNFKNSDTKLDVIDKLATRVLGKE
jgi:hypothetical protein